MIVAVNIILLGVGFSLIKIYLSFEDLYKIIRFDLKDYNSAIADFTKIIELDRDDIDAYNYRAQSRKILNDYYNINTKDLLSL